MMQKDEAIRLDPWIRYYSDLFGAERLFLYDNGSQDQSVINRLNQAAENGCHVSWDYATLHYSQRETVFANIIKKLDEVNPHDFYFPLDCDEFIAVVSDGDISLQRDAIFEELMKFVDSQDVLKIRHKYLSNPYRAGSYSLSYTSEKCFFARDACDFLANGFHSARAKRSTKEVVSNIVYFEFHNLPYPAHYAMSRAKLLPFMDDLTRPALREHVRRRGNCFHSAMDLLKSEYEYERELLQKDDLICCPALLLHFGRLGIDCRNLFAKEASFVWGKKHLLYFRHLSQRAADSLLELLNRSKAYVRRLLRLSD